MPILSKPRIQIGSCVDVEAFAARRRSSAIPQENLPEGVLPSAEDILEALESRVRELRGRLTETVREGHCLFVRALLPNHTEVQPKDAFQGGIAVRADGGRIAIRYYLYRHVCSNGAIAPQEVLFQARPRLPLSAPSEQIAEAIAWVREALDEERLEAAFENATQRIARIVTLPLSKALRFWQQPPVGLIAAGVPRLSVQDQRRVLDRFEASRDRSQFAWMNAVTSVARDEKNPAKKWELEELGGAVPWVVPEPVRSEPRRLDLPQVSEARACRIAGETELPQEEQAAKDEAALLVYAQ